MAPRIKYCCRDAFGKQWGTLGNTKAGIKPGAPAMGAQRINHWTTREVPPVPFLPLISSVTLGESFSFSSSVTWRVWIHWAQRSPLLRPQHLLVFFGLMVLCSPKLSWCWFWVSMKEADHRKPNVDLLGLRSQQSYRASVGACPGLGVGNVLETP